MDEEQWKYVKRIDSIRHKVGKGGGKVLDFLKENYREAAFMNGTAIANRCGVDPAVVTRISQRLGYFGFPDVHREIQDRVKADLAAIDAD